MPKYDVRLESQTDSQARLCTVEADRPEDAREAAEKGERKRVNFSLLPPAKDVWEDPYRHGSDDAIVDLSLWDQFDPVFAKETAKHKTYKEAQSAGKRRVKEWKSRVLIDKSGKVKGSTLGARSLARLDAHFQTEPYQVVDIHEIAQGDIDAQRLVRLAKQLQGNPEQWQRTLDEMRDAGIPLGAVTALLYGLPWQKQIDGSSTTVFSSATVKMALLTGYTVDQDAHDFFNDVSATEITGTGYTAGGFTFAGKTTNYTTGTDQIWLDNTTDPNWTTSTLSATDAVVWVDTGGASSTDPVYGAIDFGATVTTTAGTFTVALDAVGWANFDLT